MTRSLHVPGAPAAVWAKLAEFDRVTWVKGIESSHSVSATTEGVGAARRVHAPGMTVIEAVTLWKPETELAYTIHGLPSAVGSVSNHWHLAPAGRGTLVTITSTVEPPATTTGRIAARVLLLALGKASDRMLRSLASQPWPVRGAS
ncbi:MAG: SRPBCC family protein [Polyangiales bacterium]